MGRPGFKNAQNCACHIVQRSNEYLKVCKEAGGAAIGGVHIAWGLAIMKMRNIWALAVFGSLAVSAVAADEGWTYDGEAGPDRWGDLASAFELCALGAEQSPIDLVHAAAIATAGRSVEIVWTPFVPEIVDNGHTLQVNTDGEGGFAAMDGVRYDLLQFHFHHQSEHAIDGARSPLEVHFVHQSEAGNLLVLGVMMQAGEENPVFAAVQAAWPEMVGSSLAGTDRLDASGLLPDDAAAFHYHGSLTTPPCSQIAFWNVFAQPIEVSQAQIAAFAARYPNNSRPLQPLNRRFVLLTGQ